MRETVEPSLRGYAGWFDREINEIAVGEDLDADTIYHELSHAWFNGAVSTQRWFTEGLAQVYAAELVRRDGGDPRRPAPPATDAPGGAALGRLGFHHRRERPRRRGVRLRLGVLGARRPGRRDRLRPDSGRSSTRSRDGTSAYDADVTGERPDEDWQRVYDVVVEIGGAMTARDVFQAHVVDTDGAGLIELRDRAAADVAQLSRAQRAVVPARRRPQPVGTVGVRRRRRRAGRGRRRARSSRRTRGDRGDGRYRRT